MTAFDLALLAAKVGLLLAGVWGLAFGLRRATAAHRHGLWSLAFLALIALTPLTALLPSLRIPVPDWPSRGPSSSVATPPRALVTASVAVAGTPALAPDGRAHTRPDETPRALALPSSRTLLLAGWMAGAFALIASFLVSMLRVRALAGRSVELTGTEWGKAVERASVRLGMTRRVRVVASPNVTMPMAGGILAPTVLVPLDATAWTPEQRDVVLAHEIAHLAHADPLRNLAVRVAVAIYWFHPLVWLAARNAAAACEEACDEAVLRLGTRPSSYAQILLDFAGARPLRFASATLPMARRSSLETRVMTILNRSARPRSRRSLLLPAATFAALTFTVAAAKPVSRNAVADASTIPPRSAVPVSQVDNAIETATTPVTPAARTEPTNPRPLVQQRASDCVWDRSDSRSFSGSISTSRRGSSTIIHERIGTSGGDRIIQTSFGDLRVCAVAIEAEGTERTAPSEWASRARRMTLETRQDGDVRTMEIVRGDLSYTVNGRARDVDAAALAWRDALYTLLDRTWELSRLRGEVSSLRGEIASVRGERSSLQGQIASLRGQVASMRGQVASAQGQESSLRGQISSIRGHESSMRGQISSLRGSISTLEASRRYEGSAERSRIDERIRRYEDRIAEIEREIREYDTEGRVREVERRIARLDTDGQVASIERGIREFEVERKVEEINRQIARLDVEGRVRSIEREIDGLDYERRARQLEASLDDALARMRSVLRR